jgi:ribosomal protein S18 acetylase RimI-like enzyme
MNIGIQPLTPEVLTVHVREFLDIDKNTIGERWGEDQFTFDMPGKWSFSKVAIDDQGNAVGFAVASLKPHGIHIHRIAVSESCRGLGIGKRLLGAVAAVAHAHGVGAMTLKVAKENIRAVRFYHGLGFVESEKTGTNLLLTIPTLSLLKEPSGKSVP